jgi:hypothetical protein
VTHIQNIPLINKNTKVREALFNYRISKITPSHHLLLRFKEKETQNYFEYISRNYDKKIFSTTQEFELVEYFRQPAKLGYSHRKKVDVKLIFQYGKENCVNLSHT